jgi:hypothetical protein
MQRLSCNPWCCTVTTAATSSRVAPGTDCPHCGSCMPQCTPPPLMHCLLLPPFCSTARSWHPHQRHCGCSAQRARRGGSGSGGSTPIPVSNLKSIVDVQLATAAGGVQFRLLFVCVCVSSQEACLYTCTIERPACTCSNLHSCSFTCLSCCACSSMQAAVPCFSN